MRTELLAVTAIASASVAALVTDRAVAVAALMAGGVAAGTLARSVLVRLPRGMPVRAGPFEVALAVLWGLVACLWAGGELPGWWVPTACVLLWVSVPLVAVDVRHKRLPDALTLGVLPLLSAALAVAAWGGGGWALVVRALVGAAVFLAVHLVVAALRPGALGGGDVKLAIPVGAVLGVVGMEALLVALGVASMITLALIVSVPRWRGGAPHGPGMLGAACVLAVVAM
jgi:leader peptidase (prepilin peptidase)/N-methyltransferase